MSQIYRANYRYTLFMFIAFMCLFISAIVYLFNKTDTIVDVFYLLFPLMILYFLWITPYEIITDSDAISFKTFFKNRKVLYVNIAKVVVSYSTKSLIWEGGDKRKAHMLCFVRLSKIPVDYMMINNSIDGYHDLCEYLQGESGKTR